MTLTLQKLSFHDFGGHIYGVASYYQNIDWSEAVSDISGSGWHLATLTTVAETEAVAGFLRNEFVGRAYIGLSQLASGTEPGQGWTWVTGEPFSFSNWAPGEPNDAFPGEDIAELYDTGTWNDIPDRESLSVVYEIDPTTGATAGTSANDWMSWKGADATRALEGGAGQDMLSMAGNASAVDLTVTGERAVILQRSWAAEWALALDFEAFTGTSFGDFLRSDVAVRFRALGGNDWIQSSPGADTIDGGAGRDVLVFNSAGPGVQASLLRGKGWTGDAHGDRYVGIEDLQGTTSDDILTGNHGANELLGYAGDDRLIGNGGNDILNGGSGIDTVVFSFARDQYDVIQQGASTWRVFHWFGARADGNDLVLEAEFLQFADEILAI